MITPDILSLFVTGFLALLFFSLVAFYFILECEGDDDCDDYDESQHKDTDEGSS